MTFLAWESCVCWGQWVPQWNFPGEWAPGEQAAPSMSSYSLCLHTDPKLGLPGTEMTQFTLSLVIQRTSQQKPVGLPIWPLENMKHPRQSHLKVRADAHRTVWRWAWGASRRPMEPRKTGDPRRKAWTGNSVSGAQQWVTDRRDEKGRGFSLKGDVHFKMQKTTLPPARNKLETLLIDMDPAVPLLLERWISW